MDYAIQGSTTKGAEVVQFRLDIRRRLQTRLREAVEAVPEEELGAALGAPRYERTDDRRGYRNGVEERCVTTATGTRNIQVPRGRVVRKDGSTREFRSELLPRYARRTEEVDSAILTSHLAGANSRRIRKALEPLLGEEHLSAEMPVQKFRSTEELNDAPSLEPMRPDFERFLRHCARHWTIAPERCPRGVFKFRTIQEAQRARNNR